MCKYNTAGKYIIETLPEIQEEAKQEEKPCSNHHYSESIALSK